jgi:hypothetical protein
MNSEPSLFDQTPMCDGSTSSGLAKRVPSAKIVGDRARSVPFRERPTCTVAEACSAAGLGRTKLYELIGGGVLETTTVGRRRLVFVQSLLRLLNVPKE